MLLFTLPTAPAQAEQVVRIGVLSHRGPSATLQAWTQTANYLDEKLPGYHFDIIPLDFDQIEPWVAQDKVDFVLANPGIYVNLEVRHRVSRIATLNNRLGGTPYNKFGGVIFTRADRKDIRTLKDLVGTTFAAVDRTSLGGFEMAWRQLHEHHIEPARDFKHLIFAGTHDAVVFAVLRGQADAGTVRTDILERMAAAGTIKLSQLRVLGQIRDKEFPFLHSTRLYPEWPFSKVHHTSNELAQKVAVALLSMSPRDPAAVAGDYAGWTIPLDYQPVHKLFQELKLPPYDYKPKITAMDVVRQYGYWLLGGAITLLLLGFLSVAVIRLNRELEKAQRFLESKHELILNSVTDGIYGVDLQGNSTFINKAMQDMTGWTEADMIGHNQHILLHHTRGDGSHFDGADCPVYHTFRDNRPRFVHDDIFWRKDRTAFPVEYSSTPIRDTRGHTVGAVVVFRDITERKKSEEEARQHQAELAHVARLSTMGEMAAGIAHEINQPLSAIANYTRGCIRMLRTGGTSSEVLAEVMERVAVQADRAGEIIRQLREFVRKEEPRRAVIEINGLVRNVSVLLGPDLRKARVALRMELADDLPPVRVQAIQIEQVILNLARNAVEAIQEASNELRALCVSTRLNDDGLVEVEVCDTGNGLDPASVDRIFDQFFTTKRHGMGLGLSISRGIIEAHAGRMTAHNNEYGGASFSFVLPPLKEGES